jgi:hypothetical protein
MPEEGGLPGLGAGSTPNCGADWRRGGAGARVPGCWRVHLRGRVTQADERGCTVPCERRRLPGDALIEREVGLGLFDEVPARHRLVLRALNSPDKSRHERLTDIGPAKRLGQSVVEKLDEVEDALLEIFSRQEPSALEQSACQDA